MAEYIERAERDQSNGFHDQGIALPLADGIAEPTRLRIVGVLPAVREDLAEVRVRFNQHEREFGRLDDFERRRERIYERSTGGRAEGRRRLGERYRCALLVFGPEFGAQWRFFRLDAGEDVEEGHRRRSSPSPFTPSGNIFMSSLMGAPSPCQTPDRSGLPSERAARAPTSSACRLWFEGFLNRGCSATAPERPHGDKQDQDANTHVSSLPIVKIVSNSVS